MSSPCTITAYLDMLRNLKFHLSDMKVAAIVIDRDVSSCNLTVEEDILWESYTHVSRAFIAAAASCDRYGLHLRVVLLERYRWLVNDEELLV